MGDGIGSAIGGLFGYLATLVNLAWNQFMPLSVKENQANEFTASLQEDSQDFSASQSLQTMDFNALEAQKNRDFQLQMDSTLYQRRVADMQAAGINPATMFGTGVVGTSPQGSQASTSPVSSPSGASIQPAFYGMSLLNGLADAMLKMSEVDLNQKQAGQVESFTNLMPEYYRSIIDFNNSGTQLNTQKIDYYLQNISSLETKQRLDEAKISETDAVIALTVAKCTAQGLSNDLQMDLNPLLVEMQTLTNKYQRTKDSALLKEIEEKQAHIEELYSQAALNGAMRLLARENAGLAHSQSIYTSYLSENISVDTLYNETLNKLKNKELGKWDFSFGLNTAMTILNGASSAFMNIGMGTGMLGTVFRTGKNMRGLGMGLFGNSTSSYGARGSSSYDFGTYNPRFGNAKWSWTRYPRFE